MKTETQKAKVLLESSFLEPLLKDPSITDISYNGQSIYYQSSMFGRQKAEIEIPFEQVFQLLKQLANLTHHSFSYAEPILDISVGPYRMHAVGEAIARKMYEKTLTFSLRIHQPFDPQSLLFLHPNSHWRRLMIALLKSHTSIVISGITGVGKTQIQKELLSLMEPKTRVILIDNILELDGVEFNHLDLTIWQEKETAKISSLLTAALRSHPDWLIIAEARGQEFKDVFSSVVTGHPLITTIHSKDVLDAHIRMGMMILQSNPERSEELVFQLKHFFPCVLHVRKESINGKMIRFIDSILWIEKGIETMIKEQDIDQFMKMKHWDHYD
jgi:pilus assembly protein CpaF